MRCLVVVSVDLPDPGAITEVLDGINPPEVPHFAGEVRVVQDLTLLAWHFGPVGAPPVVSGTDISIVEDGRIRHLYTMLDAAPAPEAQA
mgnify:CR=1 FL=1